MNYLFQPNVQLVGSIAHEVSASNIPSTSPATGEMIAGMAAMKGIVVSSQPIMFFILGTFK